MLKAISDAEVNEKKKKNKGKYAINANKDSNIDPLNEAQRSSLVKGEEVSDTEEKNYEPKAIEKKEKNKVKSEVNANTSIIPSVVYEAQRPILARGEEFSNVEKNFEQKVNEEKEKDKGNYVINADIEPTINTSIKSTAVSTSRFALQSSNAKLATRIKTEEQKWRDEMSAEGWVFGEEEEGAFGGTATLEERRHVGSYGRRYFNGIYIMRCIGVLECMMVVQFCLLLCACHVGLV